MKYKEEDLSYVEAEIFKAIELTKNTPQAEDILADVRSNLKYSFGNALGTTDGVAGLLASFLSLTGDPATLNNVFRLYEQVTPQVMQEMAGKYFLKTNSTVVTLSGGNGQ